MQHQNLRAYSFPRYLLPSLSRTLSDVLYPHAVLHWGADTYIHILFQDSLYGFPILFTVTSEHIRLSTF